MKHIFMLEGPDGCGKTNHSDLLNEKINKSGIKSIVYHHSKPTVSNSYLAYFNQRKEVYKSFIESDDDVLVLDRGFYSSMVYSVAAHAKLNLRAVEFDKTTYNKVPEVVEEINYLTSIKNLFFNILVINCQDHLLNDRLTKRGEEVLDIDHKMRYFYRSELNGLPSLENLYDLDPYVFTAIYLNFTGQTKEEFSEHIMKYFNICHRWIKEYGDGEMFEQST